MRVSRHYIVALLAVAVLGMGYFGVTQVGAAVDRAHARADARESAAAAIVAKTQRAKEAALLARVKLPKGFQLSPCNMGGASVCATTPLRPSAALAATLANLRPLGLVLRKNACDDPSNMPAKLRVAMGQAWLPCSAFGKLHGLGVSVVTYPERDRSRSAPGHIVFGGTKVSVDVFTL